MYFLNSKRISSAQPEVMLSLSVYDTWEACEEQRRRERSRIGRVRLAEGAGAMRRTHGHHFVLWPAAKFDILACTTVEKRR